jgi:hypothetical protein
MHCYFHLVSDHETVPDETGIEVPNLEAARDWAIEVIQEVSPEAGSSHDNWTGWSVMITDAAGTVLCTISLDRQPFHAVFESPPASNKGRPKVALRTLRLDWRHARHGKALRQ